MSDSIIFYLDRSGSVNIVASTDLPHTNDLNPIMKIAEFILHAGYTGVIIDQYRMANGRYFQALNVDLASPEGRVIDSLKNIDQASLPTPQNILEKIRSEYRRNGGLR